MAIVESSAARLLATAWLINAKWAGGPVVSHSSRGARHSGGHR